MIGKRDMRPLLDLVEHEMPWTVSPEPDCAVAACRVLQVRSRRAGPRRLVVQLDGEVDMLTTFLLAERLDQHLSQDLRQVVLDLSGLTFLSASGLNVLVAAHTCARARGIAMSLTGCGAVDRVFDAAGLREHFDFVGDCSRFSDRS
ncbi:STAS domain-containing protein [Lentzea rhizosphaerae]|uniref:STAS domain-containing protein n=1 Tax=Lentzea rhizosphaerae TaxID=2041025 RepID=A0ABV8C527_9PSEU